MAATALYERLLIKQESKAIVLPKLFECIINKSTTIGERDLQRLNEIIEELEKEGEHDLVTKCRSELLHRTAPLPPKKGWWQWWKK